MFDVAPTELLLVAIVALLVIGPKDLPKAMRFVGHWVGRARGVARQFRSGFDAMVREAELAEMEKKWAEENARIMREHPPEPTPALPAPTDGGAVPTDQGPSGHDGSAGEASAHPAPDVAHDAAEPKDAERAPVMVEKPIVAAPANPEAPATAPDKAAS